MTRPFIVLLTLFASFPAWAQNPPAPAEGGGEPISGLMFFTLGAVLLLAIGSLLWFLRRRSNRAAMEHAFKGDRSSS